LAKRGLRLKFGPLFMKKYILIFWLCSSLNALAQLGPGNVASDFTVQDIQGNSRNLFSQLDSGKTVLLHCFATWDSYAWEFYQQNVLDAFNSLYGSSGNGSVAIWRVECETQNTLSQLQGPSSLTGDYATDTQGDWLSESALPVIDDSTLAAQFNLPYLPLLIVICPDRVVRFANQMSLGNLANLVFQNSCPNLSQGFDPAILSALTTRDCGSNLVDVQMVIKNLGTDTLFNASIGVSGSTPSQSFQWQGQLLSYQSDTLTIEGLEVLGDGYMQLAIEDTNEEAGNDTLRLRSNVGFSTQLVKLELALDAYPDEVSWEIRNEDDSVLYNGGGYDVDYQYINNVFQLPSSGCYNFFLNDSRGDGLHGSQYGGFDGFCKLYSMTDSTTVEEVMFEYDGSYNISAIENTPAFLQYAFEAGSPLPVTDFGVEEWSVFPNPANGFIQIKTPELHDDCTVVLYDLTGRVAAQYRMLSSDSTLRIDVANLVEGVYALQVELASSQIRLPIVVQHF
jgi:hypothetical protein